MKVIWACKECGHAQAKWTGSCPSCRNWNTLHEEKLYKEEKRFVSRPKERSVAIPITEVKGGDFTRSSTLMGELDRLLGGGLVKGSLTLIGGEPGVGKSTLTLQIANALASKGAKVLYISGEESAEQTSLRARRLRINAPALYLLSETNFQYLKEEIDRIHPDVVIVDSIQIVYKPEISSAPGSLVQLREVATEFLHLAKGHGITTFLIGHITKSGEIAGPKVLEHLVDTVLEFEGDRQHGFRLLRAMKNRFGATDEIAIFQMRETGLDEIENPSQAFLEERMQKISGSAIVPGLEGARSFLLEIQALVTSSPFPNPSRKCAGLDANRLGLLLAVLDKRVGYQLYHSDVFVALAGGLKIVEPAIDIGILLAIASSFTNRPIPSDCIVMGEVGLGGEVRGVTRVETRLKEAIHMGFQRCVLPKKNCKGLSKKIAEKIELIGVELVDQAIERLLS